MADLIISIFLLAFSIYYITATSRLPVTLGSPVGPKGFPLLIAFLLIVSSSILLLKSLKSFRGRIKKEDRGETRKGNLFWVTLTMIGYVFLLKFTGYILSTFLFLITVLMVWNRGRPYLNTMIALLAAMAAYFLMNSLKVTLPEGILGLP
jgi:hypothetical protein